MSQEKIIGSIIVSQFLRRVRAEVVYKVKPQQLGLQMCSPFLPEKAENVTKGVGLRTVAKVADNTPNPRKTGQFSTLPLN